MSAEGKLCLLVLLAQCMLGVSWRNKASTVDESTAKCIYYLNHTIIRIIFKDKKAPLVQPTGYNCVHFSFQFNFS